MDSPWEPIASLPEGVVAETRIKDGNGIRNEAKLKRVGNLWFVPDGSTYVYYVPTEWRPA